MPPGKGARVQPLWPSDTQHGGPVQHNYSGTGPAAKLEPSEGAGGCATVLRAVFMPRQKVVPLPVG